jgi:hypothetical protein
VTGPKKSTTGAGPSRLAFGNEACGGNPNGGIKPRNSVRMYLGVTRSIGKKITESSSQRGKIFFATLEMLVRRMDINKVN